MLDVRLARAAPRAVAWAVPMLLGAASVAGFGGAAGEACALFPPEGRRLLVGLGRQADPAACRAAGALTAVRLADVARIALDARGLDPDCAAALAEGACLRAWRYDRLRTRPDEDDPKLAAVDLVVDDQPAASTAWAAREAAVRGALLARDLVSEPSDTLTPAGFVARLRGLARHGLTLEVLKPTELRRARMGALLAVGRASANPPRLAVLRWEGAGKRAPVAFVGKGITFDTGGVCIKPADRMWEMRADMAGAAAAVGAMVTLARRNAAMPAVAVLPLAENAIGAASYRPGDVLRSHAGPTIEVIDTDAEGRLVLADALSWTARTLRPTAMIDLATLTGSIVSALGRHNAGLFSSDATLAEALVAAGAEVGEPVWPMPIGERHRADLNSAIADLRHCAPGRMQPDACQAAAFLREFTHGVAWAHLDIAGMDLREEADDLHPAGATGFGARLLDRLVARRFEAAGDTAA